MTGPGRRLAGRERGGAPRWRGARAGWVAAAVWLASGAAGAEGRDPVSGSAPARPPEVAAPAGEGTGLGPSARREAMVEAAAAHGAADGMARRGREIAGVLEARAGELDAVYRFGALTIRTDGFEIAPPVVLRTDGALRIGTGEAASARHVLRIAAPARIVARTPDWRDYLVREWPDAEPVHSALAPRDEAERAAFAAALAEGRRDGAALADAIHAEDLDRLERDFLGMVEWRRLRAAGMATAPSVEVGVEGVSGGGLSMRIDEARLAIPERARLNPVMEAWRPSVRGELGEGGR